MQPGSKHGFCLPRPSVHARETGVIPPSHSKVLCGLLNCVCWLALAWTSPGVWATVTLLVLGSFSTACADVVADSIVVQLCRGEAQARC